MLAENSAATLTAGPLELITKMLSAQHSNTGSLSLSRSVRLKRFKSKADVGNENLSPLVVVVPSALSQKSQKRIRLEMSSRMC